MYEEVQIDEVIFHIRWIETQRSSIEGELIFTKFLCVFLVHAFQNFRLFIAFHGNHRKFHKLRKIVEDRKETDGENIEQPRRHLVADLKIWIIVSSCVGFTLKNG